MDYVRKTRVIANSYYNMGLERARLRDLSGAAECLKKSLHFNKYQTDARNLLGLIYYEVGEVGDALVQWVISMNPVSYTHLDVYKRQVEKSLPAILGKHFKKYTGISGCSLLGGGTICLQLDIEDLARNTGGGKTHE